MDTTTSALVYDEEVPSAVAALEYELSQVLSGEITWDEFYAQKAD